MNQQSAIEQAVEIRASASSNRLPYVTPRIQQMSEKDILTTFQITQSMGAWWTNGVVTPCV